MTVVFEGGETTKCQGRLLVLHAAKKGCANLRRIASPKNQDIDVVNIDAIVVDAEQIWLQCMSVRCVRPRCNDEC